MNYKKAKKHLLGIVLDFMEKNCHGYNNAKTLDDIMALLNLDHNLDLPERSLREILSKLRKQTHVASCVTNPKGYWFIPLKTNDPDEMEAVRRSLWDKKKRAINLIKDVDNQLKMWEDKITWAKEEKTDLFIYKS